MSHLLLAAHVVAGILFVGPVAVTTSLFARFVPVRGDDLPDRDAAVARMLHRVTRGYGVLAVSVPLIGLVLAAVLGRLTEVWVVVAMVLTAAAGGLLMLRIVPAQADALRGPVDGSALRSFRASAGVFNLLWVAVVVLMVLRPGARA